MKESRKNETFAMKPSVKNMLLRLCNKYDISQAKMLERLIIEKAKKVKLYEVAQ